MIRPILFNTDMVRAILDERKTETRRKIKFPKNRFTGEIPKADSVKVYKNTLLSDKIGFHEDPHYGFDMKPPCKRGDVLYIRETWGWCPCWDCGMDMEEGGCAEESVTRVYNQKKREYGCYCYKASMEDGEELSVDTWHPSIHMPKEVARIWLKVKDVGAERLQDISGHEVLKEGINSHVHPEADYFNLNQREMFEKIWNSTIQKSDQDLYGWNANPWVWVIRFERCEKPEGWCV